jgi:hypothetical protein
MSGHNPGNSLKGLFEPPDHVDDGGFTPSVMHRLPQPRRKRSRTGSTIVLGFAALAAVFGLGVPGMRMAVFQALSWVTFHPAYVEFSVGSVLMGLLLLGGAVAVLTDEM